MRRSLTAAAVLVAATALAAGAALPANAVPGSVSADDAADRALARAAKITALYVPNPTKIGVTAPLKKKAPAGVKVCSVSSGSVGSNQIHDAIKEASAVLGWPWAQFVPANTPERIKAQFAAALDAGCKGIFMTGIEPSLVGSDLVKRSTDMGVYVVDSQIGEATPARNWSTAFMGPTVRNLAGQVIAAAVTVQSKGTADIQIMGLPLYPTLQLFNTSFIKNVKLMCPKCQMAEQPFQSLADIGTKMPKEVVSLLQRDPSINWIVAPYGDMLIGVQPALNAAQIPAKNFAINILGNDNLASLRAGTLNLAMAQSQPVVGWRMVDNMARFLVSMPQQQAPAPMQVLTPKTVHKANFDPTTGIYIGVRDYKNQFLKLWLLKK